MFAVLYSLLDAKQSEGVGGAESRSASGCWKSQFELANSTRAQHESRDSIWPAVWRRTLPHTLV